MKTVYLAREQQPDGSHRLVEISAEKWHAIIKEQAGLPMEQKRHFIEDIIYDENGMDCLTIETSLEEWRRWDNNRKKKGREAEHRRKYLHLSLDYVIDTETGATLMTHSTLGAVSEDEAYRECLFEDMRKALADWKPWALRMLQFYMESDVKHANKEMMEEFHVKLSTVCKYKKQFEAFMKEYLS